MLRTIKSKLILFTLCISLIPIFIITTISYLNARSTVKNQILQELTAIAESKKIHTLSFIKEKSGRTIDFSSDGFIRDCLETISSSGYQSDAVLNLNEHLKENKKPLDSHIVAIAVVDMNGKVVSSTNEEIIGADVSKHDIYVKSIRNAYSETYVGNTYRYSFLDEDCIFVTAPLTSRYGGEEIGIIINAYDLKSLNEITANRVGMGESGEVYIVNRDKKMITESRFIEDAIFNQVVDTEPVRRIIEDDNSGMTSIYTGYRGVPVVGASIDIPEYGWILLAESDKAEAFAPLRLMRNIAVILGGVCSAAVVGIGIVFSHSTSRPINKLKDATDRFAAGEFKQKVAIKHNDEIGALANSFNTMAEEIKVLTESLERRIAERTQELSHINEELLMEIYWRKRTEEELRKLSRAVEQSSSIIMITDINGDIEYVNPKFIQTTGYTFVEVIGQNPRILKSGKQAPEVYKELWGKIKSGKEWRGEFQNKKKNGELYWESASISSAKDEKGTITNYVAVKEDITERKKAEDQIKASLREKEVLLKEIHHRVKNNMQIISSLLNLQLESIEDENIRQILKESRNRVKSMALVHEKLYQTKDLSRIDFGEYMRSLTASLLRTFGVNTDRVQLVNDIDEVFLDVNRAIPCGLIANEIVSNSIKYAFSDSATGVIKVSMHKISDCGFRDLNPQSEIVELVISDNGVGLPEGLDFRHTKTLGMELVNTLVGQLDGSIEYVNINGAEFKITFGV